MESRKSRFEDHMNTIEAGHFKSASSKQKAGAGNELLAKLAEELGLGDTDAADSGAPTAEGEVFPAASSIVEANPAVLQATDAVAMPQVAMAGGVPAIMEAGSQPNPETLVMPIISAADGNAETASDLHRTPEAVAAAAEPTSKDEAIAEAEKIGGLIAKSFQEALEKSAKDQEYTEALEILKEAGLLEGYQIKDVGIEKTASCEGFLEKIANKEKLNKDDIIGAAYELVEFNKQAAEAEEEGRQTAQNLIELMTKVAAESEDDEEGDKEKEGDEEGSEEGGETKESQLKLASLLSDPKVVEAVKTLKAKNLL
jgi:hypothetical protein